jgi:hypothetical protein
MLTGSTTCLNLKAPRHDDISYKNGVGKHLLLGNLLPMLSYVSPASRTYLLKEITLHLSNKDRWTSIV